MPEDEGPKVKDTLGFSDPADEQDIHITKLLGTDKESAAAQIWLGTLAGLCLRGAGIVTFCVDEEGCVRWVDPLHTYIDHRAVLEKDEKRKVRFVRPILSDGNPPYVGFKDGQLWVVEFDDDAEEPEEATGSQDH